MEASVILLPVDESSGRMTGQVAEAPLPPSGSLTVASIRVRFALTGLAGLMTWAKGGLGRGLSRFFLPGAEASELADVYSQISARSLGRAIDKVD